MPASRSTDEKADLRAEAIIAAVLTVAHFEGSTDFRTPQAVIAAYREMLNELRSSDKGGGTFNAPRAE